MFAKLNHLEERITKYHKQPDADILRRKHTESMIELRKKKRHELITKKRAVDTGNGAVSEDANESTRQRYDFKIEDVSEVVSQLDDRIIDPKLEDLQRFVILLHMILESESSVLLEVGISTLRKWLMENNIPVSIIQETKLCQKLVNCLSIDYKELQFECLWVITNLATVKGVLCEQLVEAKAVEQIAKFLSSEKSDEMKFQAAWALGNISSESIEYRDLVYDSGVGQWIIQKIAASSSIKMSQLSTYV